MKKGIYILLTCILLACGDGDVLITTDPTIQLEKDSIAIAEYMNSKGYENYSTSALGVRYFIVEEGDGIAIDESDFVTFNYTGALLSDTIFDTSIKIVGDSIRAHFLEDSVGMSDKSIYDLYLSSFTTSREYNPFEITYSGSGWTIQDRFIPGFSNGIAVSFREMKAGGKVVIALPSALAYGTSGSGGLVPPNTPIMFELYPIEVEKQ